MKKEFYEKCAEILGVDHDWREPVPRRTRWNTRFLGNGRMPGRGIIRWYGPNCIHVAFTNPRMNETFTSEEAVFKALKEIA